MAAVGLFALVGCAPNEGPPLTEGFEAFDRNSDDVIDRSEFGVAFDRLDLDGDGAITTTESPAIVYEADGDRDGRVSPEEFRTIDLARLEADANLDGRISRAELEAYDRASRGDLRPARQGQTSFGELRPEARWINFRF